MPLTVGQFDVGYEVTSPLCTEEVAWQKPSHSSVMMTMMDSFSVST